MTKSLLALAFGLSFAAAATAHAETKTFKVDKMHCDDCVAAVKAKVCETGKYEKCEVKILDAKKEIGQVTITTKGADKIDVAKLDKVIGDAGYKLQPDKKETKKN